MHVADWPYSLSWGCTLPDAEVVVVGSHLLDTVELGMAVVVPNAAVGAFVDGELGEERNYGRGKLLL